ncbi:MAG: VRR-NUC domain-containing protein [Acidobacteria bacterium]|nr:VRR-NUC domain-containing protein [Acidobacteriota bacterium]
MARNNRLKGGLFDGRGKPQPLALRKAAERPKTPEKDIQASFFAWRDVYKRRYPILHSLFAVPNGIWTYKAIAVSQVKQGLTSGIPDVICLAPSFDQKYFGLLIEFKSEGGKVSESQAFFLGFFADQGYRTTICRSWQDAARIVNEHLGASIPIPR